MLKLMNYDIFTSKVTFIDGDGATHTAPCKEIHSSDYQTIRSFTHGGNSYHLISKVFYDKTYGTCCQMYIESQ